MLPPIALKLGAGLVALVIAAGYGYRHGSQSVQARWDKQAQADKSAEEARAESNRLRSLAAATTYEAQRAAIARRATEPSPESRYALSATICPPAGAFGRPLELGDVPIDRSILDRLRDAGADYTGH